MAILLKSKGVKKGERVIIYMPMIPEALFATWDPTINQMF